VAVAGANHNRRRRPAPGPPRSPSAPPALGGRPAVLLAVALDREGRPAKVSALDPARRRERGPFRCAGCGEVVVARLGRLRRRHFAHRPGSTCPLTNPETALHLEAKARLLELCRQAFAGDLAVRLAARCPRCRRLAPFPLGEAGDAALAEATVGNLRVDVLVTRGGAPALALEVRVSNALDARKEEALLGLSLPTFEIDARESFEEQLSDGVLLRVARSLGLSPCAACRSSEQAEAGRALGGEAAALAELEAYRARGLFGPRPGAPTGRAPGLSAADRSRLEREFRCPECGEGALELGEALARHTCPGRAPRPVAWRGYDGALVELAWWRGAGR